MDSKSTLVALSAYMEAYVDACKPVCKELGMPQMAFEILMFLSGNPDHRTAREISRFQGFKENILSVNVNKLVTEGYLLRQSDPEDRRRVQLICTEKATPIVLRGKEIQERFARQMQQGLSPGELSVFEHCLETIAANAKQALGQKNEG